MFILFQFSQEVGNWRSIGYLCDCQPIGFLFIIGSLFIPFFHFRPLNILEEPLTFASYI